MAFARQRRLEQARRLLDDREQLRTVTAVAFICGFNDVGHFSRQFSKAFGQSPSAVLSRRLGPGYEVFASFGHVRDLPKSKLGVDVDDDFAEHYESPEIRKVIS